MSQVILTSKFRDILYRNMWQFINLDMIEYMFNVKTSEIEGVENEKFEEKHKNTICYKSDPDEEGHYVYVDKKKEASSTYEKELLRREQDDGVCHGASMIYALHANRRIPNDLFVLIDYPETKEDFKQNYKSILDFYIYLIESGLWDEALSQFFYNDVHWVKERERYTTLESKKSLETLKEYVKRFN